MKLSGLIRFFDFISGPAATEIKSEQLREPLSDRTID
tara:strand:- start:1277 stop:1387 length:111 start_codon:yes stop_codon:yes gene_type:complete